MALALDPTFTPFSRYGSYLSISRRRDPAPDEEGLWIRHHRGRGLGRTNLFHLEPRVDGEPLDMQPLVDAHIMRLSASSKVGIEFCLAEPDTLRMRGRGCSLRLEMPFGVGIVAHRHGERQWVVNARQNRCKCMFEPITGTIDVDAPWGPDQCDHIIVDLLPDETGSFDIAMDIFQSTWLPHERKPFDKCCEKVRKQFQQWLEMQPGAPKRLTAAREHAAYVNWSAVVHPEGLLTRDSMFMSKMVMDNVWSWDHCFNAMALCYHDPKLAFDQWMIMPDQQDAFGAFPDALNPTHRHFNYSKPPVHGWSLGFCIERAPDFFTKSRLREAYEPLAKWSQWWLDHRTMAGETLPYYLHGNDSGWDNSTMFDSGAPLVSPDLATFLAVQLDVLGGLAERLGKNKRAKQWREASKKLVKALLEDLWRDDHFIARRQHDDYEVHCESLVVCMPILLGKRLPAKVRTALIRRIEQFLTDFGLATELPTSPHYTPDGYWRGPIWAPSTMLIVDGLARCDKGPLARKIAERFCNMCATSGFAENFNALTGESLRDPAYTWTSSAFLILAHEYLS